MLLNFCCEFELFFLMSLIESFLMLQRHGRSKAQQGQAKSLAEVGYEIDLL